MNGKNVGTIDPLPVLDSTGVGATLVCELLAGRGSDGCNRSTARFGLGSTGLQSAGGASAETSQETLDSTNGLEGLEVPGVDEGGEVVRAKGEGGGVNGFILPALGSRACVGWCGRVEGVSGGSDGGDHVGRGGVKRMMIDCGIINSGRRIQRSPGMRIVTGVK